MLLNLYVCVEVQRSQTNDLGESTSTKRQQYTQQGNCTQVSLLFAWIQFLKKK